ncbi:MAG: hypothetical protein AAF657_21670 [Acidobacteriota bacterium]
MTRRDNHKELLAGASFLLMVAAAAAFELYSFDLWWHLAAGRLIFSGAGIPSQDPFSYTAVGEQWIDHEWLFQCFVYGLHLLGGSSALVIARIGLITLSAALVLRFVRLETGLSTTAAALLLTPFILSGRGRFLLRPELFTLLFSVLLLTALLRRRSHSPTLRELWWIPLLFVPWANLHAGMILGIVCLGLFCAGRATELILRRLRRLAPAEADGRPSFFVALQLFSGATLAGLVNPFGIQIYIVPFHLTSLIETDLFLNIEWHRPQLDSSWLYFLVLAASAAVVVVRRRQLTWTALLPLLFLVAISLRYVRNTAVFGFLAPILLARLIGKGSLPLAALRPALTIFACTALATSFLLTDVGLGIDEDFIPVDAVDFLAAHRPSGEMFNDSNLGGYLAWRLWPDVRIFTDGRNEVFTKLQRRYRQAEGHPHRWRAMLDDFGIGYAVVSYRNPPQAIQVEDPSGDSPATQMLPFAVGHFPRREWAMVYWDDTAMVFVRRSAENADLIGEHESAHVYPEIVSFQAAAIRQGLADAGACQRELEMKLEQDPGSRRARQLLAAVRSAAPP